MTKVEKEEKKCSTCLKVQKEENGTQSRKKAVKGQVYRRICSINKGSSTEA
jgi:hypothetical protein